jgi:hypothetical protein
MSPIDRTSKEKINKEASELIWTLDQKDIIDIYLQSISSNHHAIHILFSSLWNFLQNRSYAKLADGEK